MNDIKRPQISVCIPAYNRARFLAPLLDSILSQNHQDLEIVICEDGSPERAEIAAIAHGYAARSSVPIRYLENPSNFGYDGNIRELVAQARGEYCFFMGNDDLMAPGALDTLVDIIGRYPNLGFVMRSYSWFYNDPNKPDETVRYFREERKFQAGTEAIVICFRRSSVISGFIIHRDSAFAAATSQYDGSLFYQIHLSSSVLIDHDAVVTPQVLVLCHASAPPDFGNSPSEKGLYTPGGYTPAARFNMIQGAISIARGLRDRTGVDVVDDVMRDYANYFYAYVKDQFAIPKRQLWKLYRDLGKSGFSRYPIFHVYFALGTLLGERNMDRLIHFVRRHLKRTPQIGI